VTVTTAPVPPSPKVQRALAGAGPLSLTARSVTSSPTAGLALLTTIRTVATGGGVVGSPDSHPDRPYPRQPAEPIDGHHRPSVTQAARVDRPDLQRPRPDRWIGPAEV
jgi:hypothetical protein